MSYSLPIRQGVLSVISIPVRGSTSGYTFTLKLSVNQSMTPVASNNAISVVGGLAVIPVPSNSYNSYANMNYQIIGTKSGTSKVFQDGLIIGIPNLGGGTGGPIGDGVITIANLSFDPATQTELDAAVSALNIAVNAKYTKPASGIPESDLTSAVQTKLNSAGSGAVSDATSTSKGVIQLAGDLSGSASSPTVTGLAAKAPINNPTFTGTVAGVTKAMVGLSNVDNTSDANKPVSTAQATAIGAKYTKPGSGIPESDLSSAVQTKLASVGSNFVAYDTTGNSWPARPSSSLPIVFTSTKTAAAARPTDMAIGDMWIRHPDAV